MPSPSHPKIETTAALARYLGLSRWTVSRAINDHKEVKPGTARRVKAAMAELGFTPNIFGRGLRGGRTPIIGIGFRRFDWPIFTEKLATLHQALHDRDRRTIWEVYSPDEAGTFEMINTFISMRVQGVVLIEALLNPFLLRGIARLRDARIPYVLLDPLGRVKQNAVHLDREDAMVKVVTHLHGLGHRSFGLLGLDRSFPFGLMRVDGVMRTLKALDRSAEPSVKIFSESSQRFDHDYGQNLALRLLAQKPMPTALIALSDEVAIASMSTLQKAGVRVPADVSIFGYDNLRISALISPSLCTVDQNVPLLIDAAVDLLFRLIERPKQRTLPSRIVTSQLVLRQSAAYSDPTAIRRPRADV